jgi:hypothetical protein
MRVTGTVFAGLFLTTLASAATVEFDVSTNSGHWNIAKFGQVDMSAPAYLIPGTTLISPSSTGYSTGTMAGGAAVSSFDGFWVATLTFVLPEGVVNPTLNFSLPEGYAASYPILYGDDRVVLELNGQDIGNATLNEMNSAQPSDGIMYFWPVWGQAYTFTNSVGAHITTGFHSGTNTLSLIVNNTGVARIDYPQIWGFRSSTDFTGASVLGTLTYGWNGPNPPYLTPEPGTLSCLLLGFIPIVYRLRKRYSA